MDGGYAEYVIVNEGYAYPIPDVFSDIEAAPLLCAGIIGYQFVKGDDGVALVQYVAARTSGGVSSNTQNLPPQVLQILPTRIRAPGRKTMLLLKQLVREIDICLAI